MVRTLQLDEETRRPPERGIDTLASTVKVTLDPKGHYVVPDRKWGTPTATNDGVTAAKEVKSENPYENLDIQLVKEVVIETSDVAGDSTTTATALAQMLIHEDLRAAASGLNPIGLKRDIDRAVRAAVERLHENPHPVDTTADMANVATISSRDEQIDGLTAEAFNKVGKDGVIIVGGSQTFDAELEFVEDIQLDKGYFSPYSVTDADHTEAVLEDPYILISSGKISSVDNLLPPLGKAITAKGILFMVAEDVDGEALSTPVVNRIRGTFTSAAVKAPAFGDHRKAMLEGIATLTGDQVVAPEVGFRLGQVDLRVLGRARRIVVTKDNTAIVGGAGEQSEVMTRVVQPRAETERIDSDWDREKPQERVVKLAGGACIIRTGVATKVGLKEKKYHIENAVSVTHAAVEEGTVAGGGSALIHTAKVLSGDLGLAGDERVGVAIVRRSVAEPLRQIVENSGEAGYVITSKVADLEPGHGYNAHIGAYESLIGVGVTDPMKITRSTLADVASTVSLLSAIETLVVEKKEDEEGK